jgi:hypothetical protein
MKRRKSYHSTSKMAFAMGIQKEWFPQDFIKSIPRCTYHGWKNQSLNRFVGYKHVGSTI